MGSKTKIEWTDASWTPIRAAELVGGAIFGPLVRGRIGWHCEHVSEGCRNCYAEGMNKRLGTGLDFKPGHRKDIEIFLDEKMLTQPLRWKAPRRIFVCSMTDLFADFVKDEWIDRMFAVMALCPQHTFQILTKRPERMREYISIRFNGWTGPQFYALAHAIKDLAKDETSGTIGVGRATSPLPNVWLGTSCEDQPSADARIPHLLATPAAIRFLSCEPLLGPIDLTHITFAEHRGKPAFATCLEAGDAAATRALDSADWTPDGPQPFPASAAIDWVIAGGESGPKARPTHPDAPRSLRDQCAAAGVPFFFKQWGRWRPLQPNEQRRDWMLLSRSGDLDAPDDRAPFEEDGEYAVAAFHKEAAGRTLDGKIHDDTPEAA